VIFLYLVEEEDVETLRDCIQKNKRIVQGKRGKLQWKRLSSREKDNDEAICAFLNTIFSSARILPMTILTNKFEVRGVKLSSPKSGYLFSYLYGLAFKRIMPFLSKTNSQARVIIDKNSSNLQGLLLEYLKNVIPAITTLRSGFPHNNLVTLIDYGDMNDPCLQFADFIAGFSRKVCEGYLINKNKACGVCAIPLANSWNMFKSHHCLTLPNWKWEGLLYHPYSERRFHPQLL